MLPDYLWGIETHNGDSYGCDRLNASRLPMRNWNNFGSALIRASHFSGFQTTYEELKQAGSVYPRGPWPPASRLPMRNWNPVTPSSFRPIWLPDYLWGIETLPEPKSNYENSYGFQTTYEELKLSRMLRVEILCEKASRLPMRNWNPSRWTADTLIMMTASRLPMRNWNADLGEYYNGGD